MLAGAAFAAAPVAAAEPPQRIVSINLCTDQVLLALDPGERLKAVSILADDRELSAYWREAAAISKAAASLEDVLTFEPDLVLAGGFGHQRLTGRLEALGIEVLRVPEAADFEGMRTAYRRVGAALGMATKAEALVGEIDAALGEARSVRDRSAIIVSPGMLAHGEAMLGGAVLAYAGLTNAAGGRTYLRLEELAAGPPDMLILAARADAPPSRSDRLFAHPALGAAEMRRADPAALLCGTVETARLAARLAGEGAP